MPRVDRYAEKCPKCGAAPQEQCYDTRRVMPEKKYRWQPHSERKGKPMK